ncbi:hypothetical protein BC826DRAFT_310951 [Russula brevipes]|nr:hypothetical protein BC826DRAFT_310951 [Russula brevipes]
MATHSTRRRRKRSTKRGNDVLPNDVLLEIFHFYLDKAKWPEQWQILVHVCQRWRDVVFASPTRLNLRLVCTHRRPVREMLDVWPGLPIIVSSNGFPTSRENSADNIVAALERHDRVRDVSLWGVPHSLLERSAEAMQGPFPVLTFLRLEVNHETAPALPDSFLGGSAPRLRHLYLKSIPFPGMRRLLVSATNLIQLNLSNIPHSGYISPDTIVAGLSGMTRLQGLWLGFQSPRSRPSEQADDHLRPRGQSSPLSLVSGSKGSASIWKTSWPNRNPSTR